VNRDPAPALFGEPVFSEPAFSNVEIPTQHQPT